MSEEPTCPDCRNLVRDDGCACDRRQDRDDKRERTNRENYSSVLPQGSVRGSRALETPPKRGLVEASSLLAERAQI